MDELPRELRNRIVRMLDIETRLKCGFPPGKLVVPKPLVAKLLAVLKARESQSTVETPYMYKRFHESSDRKYMWYFVEKRHCGPLDCMWRVNPLTLDPRQPSFSSSDNSQWHEYC